MLYSHDQSIESENQSTKILEKI